MNLENFAKLRGLQYAYTSTNRRMLDYVLETEHGEDIRKNVLTKRLQFDTTPELYAEVESICEFLDCSKREFLEMVVSDGLAKAMQVFRAAFKDGSGRELGSVEGD